MKLKRRDTEWGRRIDAALERGRFTDEDKALIAHGYARSSKSGTCGCAVTELFETVALVQADDRLYEMSYDRIPHAVHDDDVDEASRLYDDLLKIRNEEYE